MAVINPTLEDYAHLLAQAGSELEDQLVREMCADSLYDFVREFWHVVEPGRPFVGNWHLEWMCKELEAITNGETTHLLMNVPPGAMKSLLMVFWTAWEWGPKNKPTLRYLCASYTQTLTIRDNRRRKAILSDEKYKRLWPEVKIDQNRTSDENFGNTHTGWCIATSTGGVGTGERADRVVCFPEDEVVHTEHGPRCIGDIVRSRVKIRVWSTNTVTGETSLKPITGWHTNPGSQIIRVVLSDGSAIRCTPDHRIWTRRGWVEARLLGPSDLIPSAPCFDMPSGRVGNTVKISDRFAGERRSVDGSYDVFSKFGVAVNTALSVVQFKNFVSYFSPNAACTNVRDGGWGDIKALCQNVSTFIASGDFKGLFRSKLTNCMPLADNVLGGFVPCFPGANGANYAFTDSKFFCGQVRWSGSRSYFNRLLSRKFCLGLSRAQGESTMGFGVGDVLDSRPPRKIADRGIFRVAVQVANFTSWWLRTKERFRYQDVNPTVADFTIYDRVKVWVAFLCRRGFENFLSYVHRGRRSDATLSFGNTCMTLGASHVADAVEAFQSKDRTPLFVREIGYAHETFCLSVADNSTFYVGDCQAQCALLVSNCDDAHSVNTAESDAIRNQTLHWWREVVPTRVNDPQKSAFIVIMQRVHAEDVAGDILDNRGDEWVHVMIPMRYEPDRHCKTDHGEDPRGLDEDGDLLPGMSEPGIVEPDSPLARRAGSLYWPERFPEWTVIRDSIPLGRYGVASQFQQMPSPRGGGIVLDTWWQIWPPAGEFDKWVKPVLLDDGRRVNMLNFPPAEFTIAYVDTAFTEKDGNAYCAMVCFDVFADNEGHPKVMLRNAWQERPTLKALCERILETARRHRVDCVVIENKAGAPWVKQEMQRLMRAGEFSIVLDEPRSDKVARLHAVAPLFEDKMIYAPNRDWADLVIKQVSEFPKGKYKDIVDCCSGAIGYLRRNDLIKLAVEYEEEERDKKIFRGNQGGIADLYEVT